MNWSGAAGFAGLCHHALFNQPFLLPVQCTDQQVCRNADFHSRDTVYLYAFKQKWHFTKGIWVQNGIWEALISETSASWFRFSVFLSPLLNDEI